MDLKVKVAQVKGHCPVYSVGDSFFLKEGYVLRLCDASGICMHSLASIMPFYVALSKGIGSGELGLSKGGSVEAYVRCPDPCEVTGGGTVLLELTPGGMEEGKGSRR